MARYVLGEGAVSSKKKKSLYRKSILKKLYYITAEKYKLKICITVRCNAAFTWTKSTSCSCVSRVAGKP